MNERRIRIDKTNNWTEHWEGEMKKMRFKDNIELKSFTKKEWVTEREENAKGKVDKRYLDK